MFFGGFEGFKIKGKVKFLDFFVFVTVYFILVMRYGFEIFYFRFYGYIIYSIFIYSNIKVFLNLI